MKNKPSAFSLIELSIVILVIGILIAGAVQGNKLFIKAKLSAAQSLTKSSPVVGIKNLVLWLEPTMSNSFLSTQAINNAQISRWIDINPQASKGYFAIKTASSSVVYKESSPINSLPSLYFDGSTGSYLSLSLSTALDGENSYITASDRDCSVSFFIVSKTNNASYTNLRYVLYNGTSGNFSGYGYFLNSSLRKIVYTTDSWVGPAPLVTNNTEIVSYTYNRSNNASMKMYVNGAQVVSTTNQFCKDPAKNPIGAYFGIGWGRNATNIWDGYISEIIFFDRFLKDEERKDIEKYLGQKYNIQVS